MDGIHDLGGRQGFGPVQPVEPEAPFHEPWEGRVFGLVRCMSRPDDWNLDWFRHCRELIEPADYLTRPYYDQWLQAYAAMMIVSGVATLDEVAKGKAASRWDGLSPPLAPEQVDAAKGFVPRFDRPGPAPAFRAGDGVRARAHGMPGHTRLPAYVRGHRGTVHAHHGCHVFPDARAVGEERAVPLYTVGFSAADLWPDEAGGDDRVYLDLWEPYLDPA